MSVFNHLRANSAVVSELSNKLQDLETPNSIVFRHLLSSVGVVVESISGPAPPWLSGLNYQRGSWRIIDIDVTRMGLQRFRQLYRVLLTYFVFVFYSTHLFLEEELKTALFEILEERDSTERILESLDRIGKMHMGPTGRQEIRSERWMAWRLTRRVWDEVLEIVGFGIERRPEEFLYFGLVSGKAYEDAVQNIEMELRA